MFNRAETERVTEGGERVCHLWPNGHYYGHLSVYRFAAGMCRGKAVLDAGCGTGYGCAYLAEHGATSVIGIDYSGVAIDFCREHFARDGVSFLRVDLTDLPPDLPPVDFVYASNVLEHLERPDLVLRRLREMLLPRGSILLEVPVVRDDASLADNLSNPHHVAMWSPHQWHTVLTSLFGLVRVFRHETTPASERMAWMHLPEETTIDERDFAFSECSIEEWIESPGLGLVLLATEARVGAPDDVEWVDGSFSRSVSHRADRILSEHVVRLYGEANAIRQLLPDAEGGPDEMRSRLKTAEEQRDEATLALVALADRVAEKEREVEALALQVADRQELVEERDAIDRERRLLSQRLSSIDSRLSFSLLERAWLAQVRLAPPGTRRGRIWQLVPDLARAVLGGARPSVLAESSEPVVDVREPEDQSMAEAGEETTGPPAVAQAGVAAVGVLDLHVRSAPSPQTALDIFAGEWASRLPGPLGDCAAGTVPLFEDDRVTWVVSVLSGIEGASVLELGPLEGGHTYMLEQHGAAEIVAVESNAHAYLRCLIVKELLELRRARFLCGDCVAYLRANDRRFDLCFASGILYHMTNPAELLALVAGVSDRVFLWTHYYEPDVVSRTPHLAAKIAGSVPAEHGGFHHTLYRYLYADALQLSGFCGGANAYSHWMTREDILAGLRHFGLTNIRVNFDHPDHPNGPAFAVLASREG
ncbi:MAG: methyltransferase domain-containing protein [Chloroflexi bacterium]|nr:methyltransferase domain-containing protein [Chloroflexota bacterium]